MVGGGAWGVAAALAAARRGAAVTLLEAGTLPHPLAASTDISKAIRAGYGRDALYTDLMLDAFAGWRAWNAGWPRPLFHETGVLFLAGARGGFEDDCFGLLSARGAPVEWLDVADIRASFPQWAGRYVGGYFNAAGGWAESGAVVAQLAEDARAAGAEIRENARVVAIEDGAVRLADGQIEADVIIVAAGAWTPTLLPELRDRMWASAHSVFHLQPLAPKRWMPPKHPVFGADIARTGWYGFPALADGRLKIAHHGAGPRQSPDGKRSVPFEMKARLRSFLSDALPALADAPLVGTRSCLYCDTYDGDFLIDRHPDRPGVIVAAGGSGHGFKFTPLLGGWLGRLLDGGPPVDRFAWRARGADGREDARAPD